MTERKTKLQTLTLGQIVFTNTVVIIAFMSINSFVCPDGSIGGNCVKRLDERIFLLQMIANFLFAWYYLSRIDKSKWRMHLVNILLTIVIYFLAATLHSISKAGLF
jgi:hypothetical protein